ncbi:YgcG family protein [Pseudomonas sp. ZM23]|uniref:YgcG family protein n=1 Tax=Pseudomonas triclosanedens TaxID=2961893 RepID=A0ABY6ZW93_9PSED|nr:YgcG family protein [Pseudomonas triclosanedens]MCP8467427.1 YgcG family protein [Pseudomonas triclosanedens]MCP8469873.1 YgcG family protein [Pseudomonas triclosanedens]MCP8478816.1 YgcG family protein [Pseudomonas triclosanedens]WAI49204.1 YgcG family protein [Pseudomonas triclosanedens]
MILPRWLLAALLLCWTALLQAAPVAIPPLNARVTDLTQTLGSAQRAQLESQLAGLEQRKGAQLAVLMLPTTGEDSIEDYAVRAFEQWKLGRKGVDDGVLLVIAKNDRALRIEVGYGLEGTITDVQAGRIIRDAIVPRFKTGDFAGGVQAGVDNLIALIDPPANAAPQDQPGDRAAPIAPASNYSDIYSNQNANTPEAIPPARLLGLLALLVGVPLLCLLFPVQWLRQRSMGRYLLCSALVGGVASAVLLLSETNPEALQQQMIGSFSIPLVLYIFFLPPMWLTSGVLQLLWMIVSSIGRGGGGRGGGGGGGGFRGGGGSSGGGGASGRW